MNCEQCGGTGWIVLETSRASAARACECRRDPIKPFRDEGKPLDNLNVSISVIRMCEVLAFAPTGAAGREMIAEALKTMCETAAEVEWTTVRACQLYTRWEECGIPGLRQIVSSFRKPKDGVSLSSTPTFPDGLPAMKTLPAPKPLQLEAGTVPAPFQPKSGTLMAVRGFQDLPELSREQRKRQQEFDQVLMAPEERTPVNPPVKRRQSQIVLLANDPEHEPLPEGSYKRITEEDAARATAEYRSRQRQKAG